MTTRIDILMCTFRRPEVAEAIGALGQIDLPPGSDLRLIVADNDDSDSARQAVLRAAAELPFACHYIHAPARNISVARNACLDAASQRGADWIISLDDDELVRRDWLVQLLAAAQGHDGSFGKVQAVYSDGAPGWMRALDLHSAHPEHLGRQIRTGISGNAALRWRGTDWQDQRFDLSRGRSGGEDTEFFLRLYNLGARFAAAPLAIATEPVPPSRQSIEWLSQRRFRMGQTHVITAQGPVARARLMATALAKAGYCRLREKTAGRDETGRYFWHLRGQLHRGVVAGLLNRPQAQLYGGDPV